MGNGFESLNQDDVVTVNVDHQYVIAHTTFKVAEFAKQMATNWTNFDNKKKWYVESVDCEVLKPGAKRWQKGKVRITLEFCPDEPESPLDDLRQQLKQIEHQ